MTPKEKLLTNPDQFLIDHGYIKPSHGYISPAARKKARLKRKKKK